MEPRFRKIDFTASFVIGVLTAAFLIVIFINLRADIGFLNRLLAFKWYLIALFPVLDVLFVYLAFRMGAIHRTLYQFGKFMTIGIANTSIDLGVLNVLLSLTGAHTGPLYSLFKAFSFILATLSSYFWNKLWTFENPGTHGMRKQFLTFMVVSGMGFIIDVVLATIIVNLVAPMGGLSQALWANIAAIVALFVTVIWNFLGYKFIVFKE